MHDKVFGGVAGGLADYLGIGAFGLRLVFGFSAIVVGFLLLRPSSLPYGAYYYASRLASFRDLVKTGAGLAVVGYFGLWVFVPAEDADVSAVRSIGRKLPRLSGVRTWLATLAFIGGATVLGSQLGLWSGDIIWAFLLIGVGLLLFRRDAERATGGGGSVASDPVGVSTTPEPPPIPTTWSAVQPPGVPPRTATASPRPPRERSPLGWLVLGLALLAVGIAAIAQNLGLVELRLVDFPAIGILVLGTGMFVGAFAGRARWLAIPALPLALLVLAFSVIHVPLVGGLRDIFARPMSLAHIPGGFGETSDGYRVIAGNVYVDLTGFQCEQQPLVVNASSGFGNVTLYVPFDAHVIATGSVGLGHLGFGTFGADGVERYLHHTLEPRFGDGPTIRADLQSGIGNVYVYRESLVKRQRDKACT